MRVSFLTFPLVQKWNQRFGWKFWFLSKRAEKTLSLEYQKHDIESSRSNCEQNFKKNINEEGKMKMKTPEENAGIIRN